ncbi:MAG: nickel/cobalt transporter [Thalassospira sp.]|jgi:nickel/cobalt exporter|nr:nickel/cobalt transporter [Thalassospira sp.]
MTDFSFSSLILWIQQQQRLFNDALSTDLRAVAETHSVAATVSIMLVGFFYGVFHAAGPGHGKVIITSYLLAGENTLRRGLIATALSSLLQAITAIVLVLGLFWALDFARSEIESKARHLESVGYILMAVVGLVLLRRGIRPIFSRKKHEHHHCNHSHDTHQHNAHKHEHHHHGTHNHEHHHHEGCSHTIQPQQLDAAADKRTLLLMILSVGMRPCSGAIVVLGFACLIGAVTAGILSTFAMALGTFITTATLALLALKTKHLILDRLKSSEKTVKTIQSVISVAAGGIIVTTAVLFLAANVSGNTIDGAARIPTPTAHPLMPTQ